MAVDCRRMEAGCHLVCCLHQSFQNLLICGGNFIDGLFFNHKLVDWLQVSLLKILHKIWSKKSQILGSHNCTNVICYCINNSVDTLGAFWKLKFHKRRRLQPLMPSDCENKITRVLPPGKPFVQDPVIVLPKGQNKIKAITVTERYVPVDQERATYGAWHSCDCNKVRVNLPNIFIDFVSYKSLMSCLLSSWNKHFLEEKNELSEKTALVW